MLYLFIICPTKIYTMRKDNWLDIIMIIILICQWHRILYLEKRVPTGPWENRVMCIQVLQILVQLHLKHVKFFFFICYWFLFSSVSSKRNIFQRRSITTLQCILGFKRMCIMILIYTHIVRFNEDLFLRKVTFTRQHQLLSLKIVRI